MKDREALGRVGLCYTRDVSSQVFNNSTHKMLKPSSSEKRKEKKLILITKAWHTGGGRRAAVLQLHRISYGSNRDTSHNYCQP